MKHARATIHEAYLGMSIQQVASSLQRTFGKHVVSVYEYGVGTVSPSESFVVSVDMALVGIMDA